MTADSRGAVRSSDEAVFAVRTDVREGSSDCLATNCCLGSGSRSMHDIQSRKDKASGTGRSIHYLATTEERCNVGSSPCHSHVKAFQ